MEQDPEDAGEDAGMHLPPELQRVIYQFARPVFRRCGRQLRVAETRFSNGRHRSYAVTKLRVDERWSERSYPAIVDRPMAPNTGVYRWTWVVRTSPTGVVMPGICTEAADPEQHSLRFTPHGAAYEPWTDLFYDFNDSNRPPPQHDGSGRDGSGCKFRQGDEIAFVLDTRFGELEIYHSYYGLRRIMRGPEFRSNTLYAYCGLEKPGDVVEYIEIDNDTGAPLARTVPRGATSTNPYFEHALQASDEWHRRWNEPRP